jgi:methylated-DNA-[protein]-cysteine S-methyltransferase
MILYDVVDTPVGLCAVAMRDGRICAMRFGKDPGVMARRSRLPEARRRLRDFFAGRAGCVPLDFGTVTPFTRVVYEVVRRIPRGRTMTYGEVARKAGRPGAARAVGTVMGRNRLCLFIPCHRVVGAAGPGGFSAPGGLALKRRLLELEE